MVSKEDAAKAREIVEQYIKDTKEKMNDGERIG